MKSSTRHAYERRILTVCLHIQSHLDQELAPDQLAALACCSLSHFHRVFRGMVGESLMEYVRRLRLERAAHALGHNRCSVTVAALDAGFQSVEAFSRAFKALFGTPPGVYRGPVPRQPDATETLLHTNIQRGTAMDVTVTTLPAQTVAFVRELGPYQDSAERAWQKLMPWAMGSGLVGPQTKFLGISHDDPGVTPPEKIRYDAAITVPEGTKGDGSVGIQTLEGGAYAVYLHKGPYSQLEAVYGALYGQWLPASGRQLRMVPCFEVYLNSPQDTPPEELLTEIHIPLA